MRGAADLPSSPRPAVRGVQPYDRLVRSALVAELSTLLDLAIGPPPPYPAKVSPLIDLCAAENRQVGEEILQKLTEALSLDLRLGIKEGRNAFGAHIELGRPFNDLIGELDDLDMDEARIVVDGVREWLEFAALYEHALQMLLWDGRVTSSFKRTPDRPGAV